MWVRKAEKAVTYITEHRYQISQEKVAWKWICSLNTSKTGTLSPLRPLLTQLNGMRYAGKWPEKRKGGCGGMLESSLLASLPLTG